MPTIAIGQAASGLDIFLNWNGVRTDPLAITYIITEPSGTIVGSGSGHKLSTGHYDARNTTIPSGYSIDSPWTIAWAYSSPGNISSTASEEFTVVDEMESVFSVSSTVNLSDITDAVKIDLALSETKYTNAQYEIFLIKSLRRINRRLNFTDTDDELSYDKATNVVSPKPNSSLYDIIILQMECLVTKSGRSEAVSKGIRVRDGDTEIDTTAGFDGHNDVARDACAELEDAIKEYKWTMQNAAQDGYDVGYRNTKIIESMDHDGEGTGRSRDWSSPFDTRYGGFYNDDY